ncbi:MAG: rhomboid family intramembrane serine protease [Candidatus Sulfotelmatobacter sp.]
MRRSSQEMTLSLPPFTRAVTWLLAINTGVYLLMELLGLAGLRDTVQFIFTHFALQPDAVLHGFVWQIVTYSFLHLNFWHWFGNMIGLWMFGSAFESSWGTRRLVELFAVGVVGAALTTIAISYTHVLGGPQTWTLGASGGVFAILIAFGMVFGENEIMLIPFPFLIKAKYFVAVLIVVTLALAMAGGGEVAYVAHLGGLFFGYLYVKRGPRKGLNLGLAERFYALHNGYYRWKRRRTARKFEVYMRKHDRDVHFDEHGNYIPPDDDPRKGNGGSKSGWVN